MVFMSDRNYLAKFIKNVHTALKNKQITQEEAEFLIMLAFNNQIVLDVCSSRI
jgi:hypothetical protein